jgi:hypothetical protein
VADPLTDWDLFVLRHRKPGNWVVHFVSLLLFYLSPVAAWATRDPWWLAGFLSSGVLGALGHFVFKDGGVNLRETTSSPTVAFFFVPRMFLRLFTGRYAQDLRTADARLAHARGRGRLHESA